MTSYERKCLALAASLAAEKSKAVQNAWLTELPCEFWNKYQQLVRMRARALERRLFLASHRLEQSLSSLLAQFEQKLGAIRSEIECQRTDRGTLPAEREIYRDLVELRHEFEHVEVDCSARTISVLTEPIEFEEVSLGAFRIVLDLSDRECSYAIIAVDPNPAASNESVTHPHVQDEALCEGDGRTAIRTALAQCRFLDFFHLVANTLRTYNADGPFVALRDWLGVSCGDCGATANPEECFACGNCELGLCDDCASRCQICSESSCSACIERCALCEESTCGSCLKKCCKCGELVCSDCRGSEDQCEECHEETLPENDAQATAPQSTQASVEILALRMGEDAVPA